MLQSVVEATAVLEDEHWWFVARRAIVSNLLQRCVPPGEGRVLVDVGCGAGGNVAELAGAYRSWGIDPNPVMIEAARRRSTEARFVCGAIPDDLPAAAHKADACLLMDVLEHVAADQRLLVQTLHLCKPGAHVLVTVPANPSLWSRHDEVHGHYRRYTVGSLRRLISASADAASRRVEVLLLTPYCARLYPLIWGLRAVQGVFAGGEQGGSADGCLRCGQKVNAEESGDLFLPPRLLNELLRYVFAGESSALRRALEAADSTCAYRRGSSLIAVLRLGHAER